MGSISHPVAARDPNRCSIEHGPCDARIESMDENAWTIQVVDPDVMALAIVAKRGQYTVEIPVFFCPNCGAPLG